MLPIRRRSISAERAGDLGLLDGENTGYSSSIPEPIAGLSLLMAASAVEKFDGRKAVNRSKAAEAVDRYPRPYFFEILRL